MNNWNSKGSAGRRKPIQEVYTDSGKFITDSAVKSELREKSPTWPDARISTKSFHPNFCQNQSLKPIQKLRSN